MGTKNIGASTHKPDSQIANKTPPGSDFSFSPLGVEVLRNLWIIGMVLHQILYSPTSWRRESFSRGMSSIVFTTMVGYNSMRDFTGRPLYVYGQTESSRPYGPLWEHHLPLLCPLGIQRLILGFVFHSEQSLRSRVHHNSARVRPDGVPLHPPTRPADLFLGD